MKKLEADTVGSPSPASVEPPAPSETPFPQEPSNANFSAECEECGVGIENGKQVSGHYGENFCPPCSRAIAEANPQFEIKEAFSADYYCTKCDEGFDSITPTDEGQFCQSCLPDSATAHDDMDATTQREDFNAFGFGKDEEEEEESEEPKTQEFTVVLQEGDKLELTDIEEETEEDVPEEIEPKEEDNTEDEENEEKEAEVRYYFDDDPHNEETKGTRTFKITDIWYDTYDEEAEGMQGIKPFHDKHGYKQSHDQPDPSEMTITLDEDEGWGDRDLDMELGDAISDESGFMVYHYNWDEVKEAENYEAVSAKVTRPVKEEEDEEKEEEGMSTLMKVGLGVGALAVGAAILGAEGEYRCPHCSNELHRLHITEKYTCPNCEGLIYEDFRDGYSDPADFMAEDEGESDYWAGENADWRAEATGSEPSNEHFSAESKLHPGLYRYKGKIGMRKGWTECQECDDIVKQKDVNWYYIKGYGQATICDSCVGKYNYKKDRLSKGGRHGELAILQFMEQDRKDADTVGNPSPSGPSSTPEPAEATGSEPSNEQFSAVVDKEFYENVSGSLCPNCGRDGDLGHFSTLYWCDDCGNEGCDGCTDDCDCETKEAESKNLKMALGITAVGIGLAAILGKDKLTKLFDRFNL